MASRKRVREPTPAVLNEIRWYLEHGEAALGARGGQGVVLGMAESGFNHGRPGAGVTDRRFGLGPGGNGEATRERDIHAAMCAIGPRHVAVLRAVHEPRNWPRETWSAWGSLVGLVMQTDDARDAFAKAVEPRGRRKVWCEVRLPIPHVGRTGKACDAWILEWRWHWQEAADAPKTRQDGLLHWLGSEAVRRDRKFVASALEAGNGLLDDAYRAYERARGAEPPEERERRVRIQRWEPKASRPARVFGVQP